MSARARFLIVLAIATLILLAFSILDASRRIGVVAPIEAFQLGFWLTAWLPFFFDHLAIAVSGAAIITFSLVLDPYELGGTGRLVPAIRSILVTILLVGILNGLWFGLLGPAVELHLSRVEYRSDVARNARERATSLENAGRYDDAIARLRRYQAIVGTSDELERRIQELRIDAAEARRADAGAGAIPERIPRAFELSGLTVPDLIARAEAALADGEYFTAHYYASVAVDQSSFRREDARRIQSEALNAIDDGIREREITAERSRYQAKLEAYQALQRGDDEPRALVDAYYQFQELAETLPDDPDVERYYAEATERLDTITFFTDELAEIDELGGRGRAVFLNPGNDAVHELIAVDRVVRAPQGDYFLGVEILRWPRHGRDGAVVHLAVPHAKRIGRMLALRSIERIGGAENTDQYVIQPEYLLGSPGNGDDGLIQLGISVDDIVLAAGGTPVLATLSLADLARAPAALAQAGVTASGAISELIARIVRVAGFFVLAFLSVSLGWEHRSHYLGRPPILVLLLVPVLPWATWWVVGFTRAVVDTAIGLVVPAAAAGTAIVAVSAVMLVALLVATTSLARQTIEP